MTKNLRNPLSPFHLWTLSKFSRIRSQVQRIFRNNIIFLLFEVSILVFFIFLNHEYDKVSGSSFLKSPLHFLLSPLPLSGLPFSLSHFIRLLCCQVRMCEPYTQQSALRWVYGIPRLSSNIPLLTVCLSTQPAGGTTQLRVGDLLLNG
jgi:hypothetical protein